MIKNNDDTIEVCLKVIEKYFTLLKIFGVGFMAMLAINAIINDTFGKIVTYASIILVGIFVIVVVLTLSKKFAIISKLILKDE